VSIKWCYLVVSLHVLALVLLTGKYKMNVGGYGNIFSPHTSTILFPNHRDNARGCGLSHVVYHCGWFENGELFTFVSN
jgi:hypothetical protein